MRFSTAAYALWTTVWFLIAAVVGGLFAARHFVLGTAALAGVVWGCIRWTRPAVTRR